MDLKSVQLGREYRVKSIATGDEALESFLFSLGCYCGGLVTVVSRRRGGCVVAIKDGRYHMDERLAKAIIVE